MELKSAVDVDDTAVQQMVEESVAHAFEDLAARRWIEAKLRAQATLAATHKALTDSADDIEPDYRARIEAAARDVTSALATEKPEAGTGDLKPLLAALTALDETTRPLADLLMDRAMAAMLRKRGLIQ